ncbi:LysR family transcriptional regulator [Adlercreutzia sp. ZJ242]|uniref:LysR family transcriptional regulator n=1 Tax=Adlercreutzia sp. ZJ242 TaxID=2709409 RepID=UPI0013EDCC2D|nr:LysR family transcriptional regulator [Adlercreutzia sp. ZJ242]
MEIGDLREFIVLAEELNYTTAADRLFLSRSSLTKHIQAVESELGVQLFERNNRSVSLTPAGRAFLQRARAVLFAYHEAVEAARSAAAEDVEKLKVGYLFATAGEIFPQICADFGTQSNVRLELRSMEVEEIWRGVTKGEIDLGLTIGMADGIPHKCNYVELLEDRFGIVVTAAHPYARRESLTYDDLRGMSLFGPHPRYLPLNERIISRYLSAHGGDLEVAPEIRDIGSICPALAMGADAVFSVGHIARRLGEHFAFVPLADVEEKPVVVLAWRKDNETSELLEFTRCMKSRFDQYQKDR